MHRNFYKVHIGAPKTQAVVFRDWLIPHMEDMENLPVFYATELYERPDNEDGLHHFECRYYFHKREDFDLYLQEYAEKMRSDLPSELRSQLKFQRFLGSEEAL